MTDDPKVELPLRTVQNLFRIFDAWWNKVGTTESDLPGQNYISIEDTQLMDDLCNAVEEYDSVMLLALRLGLADEST